LAVVKLQEERVEPDCACLEEAEFAAAYQASLTVY
jgi:hypothetical protein